jgi:hypothetical protein
VINIVRDGAAGTPADQIVSVVTEYAQTKKNEEAPAEDSAN